MKIALFTDTFVPQINGVAHSVEQLASSLSARGHEVLVVTVSEPADYSAKPYRVVLLPSIPALVYKGIRFTIPTGKSLRYLRNFQPDIIHAHTPFAVGWEARRVARRLKVPFVGTHHTFFNHYLKHIYMDWSWARKLSWTGTVRFYNACDVVISPTRSLADELQEHGLTAKIEIMPNPIDIEFFKPRADATTSSGAHIVHMGRLSYEKNIGQLLEIFASVLLRAPQARLTIIGDGPERSNLEKSAERLGLSDRITFTGFLRGVALRDALASDDIFVTTSKSENMPLAILEAMAVGLPVVAVKSLGLSEILHHGKNAFLAEPDAQSEIVEYLLRLIENPLERKSLGNTSRALASRYSHTAVAERKENLYAELLAY